MNPTYEIDQTEAIPLLQAIRDKLIESGYKCPNYTNQVTNTDGFNAKNSGNWCRVYLKRRPDKIGITWNFICNPRDPLHKQGIDYMIESTIVNFGIAS
jgi:hypothetical protein